MMHVPLLPVVAAAADRWGRRPVLLLGVFGFITFLLLLAASQSLDAIPLPDTTFGRSYPWLAFAAYVLRGITFNFGVVWASMIFDLTHDSTSRAFAFALLEASNQIGESAGGIIAGYVGHLHLLDYGRIYIALAIMVGIAFFHILVNVPESLETDTIADAESESQSLALLPGDRKMGIFEVGKFKTLVTDISSLLSSRQLVPLFVAEFLIGVGGGVDFLVPSMSMAVYGWNQGSLEYYQASTPMIVLGSTVFLVPVITSYFGNQPLPEWFIVLLSLFNVVVLSLSAFTALSPAFLLVPRYIWSLLAFQTPLMSARIAGLVPGHAQAKLFALRSASTGIAYAVALQLFTSGWLFDPAATGVKATAPFVVASVIGSVGVLLLLLVLAPQTCSRWTNQEALGQDRLLKRPLIVQDQVPGSSYT
jgi:MFS family permease